MSDDLIFDNQSINYIIGVFAAKFAVSLAFIIIILILLCCCCRSCCKGGKDDEFKKNRFKFIKYDEIYEKDIEELKSVVELKDKLKDKSKDESQNQSQNKVKRNLFTRIRERFTRNRGQRQDGQVVDIENGNFEPKETSKKYIYYVFDTMGNTKFTTLLNVSSHGDNIFDNLEAFVDVVCKAFKPEDVEILLQIESPGGLAYKYEYAYDHLMRLRKKGFIITAIIDTICASGGYMLACACNKIVCAENARIGSVGVVAQIVNYSKLSDKIGIEDITLTTGQYKRPFPTGSPYNEEDTKRMKEMIDETFETFKGMVQRGRNLSTEEMGPIQEARVYQGRKALEYKMVDEISLSTTYIDKIAECNDVYMFASMNKKKGFVSGLFGELIQQLPYLSNTIAELINNKQQNIHHIKT